LGSLAIQTAWEGISLDIIRSKPVFFISQASVSHTHYVTPELAAFVEQRLAAAAAAAVPILR